METPRNTRCSSPRSETPDTRLHPYRHGRFDARILLQIPVGVVFDVRCRKVHAEDDAEHELRRTSLGADNEVVVGRTGDKAFFDPPREKNAGNHQADPQGDRDGRQRTGEETAQEIFESDRKDRH
jgi:hypothetical protein